MVAVVAVVVVVLIAVFAQTRIYFGKQKSRNILEFWNILGPFNRSKGKKYDYDQERKGYWENQ